MTKLLSLSFILISGFIYLAGLTEDQIPFTLDSDTDTIPNIVDTDDDDDAVIDNEDAFPLDGTKSDYDTQIMSVTSTIDAGIRNNTTANSTKNYGDDATVQTKGIERALVIKFSRPSGLDLNSATLSFFSDDEDDPLEVYFVANTDWEEGILTYFKADSAGFFSTKQLIGTTSVPSSPTQGEYTIDVPVNILPASGDFTILIYDPNDPSGATEKLYTSDSPGKEATIDYNYNVLPTERVIIDQSSGTTEYVNGGMMQVEVRLSQAPTNTVWVPFAISDTSKAKIFGDEVLVFDASNWNTNQTLMIDPSSPGMFDVFVRPLHSMDAFYNGHNPLDLLGYSVQSSNITNLGSWSVNYGDSLKLNLMVQSGIGSTKFDFRIVDGPDGLNVVENSGRVCFRPLSNQIGIHPVTIEVTDDKGNISLFHTMVTVNSGTGMDPIGLYVIPDDQATPSGNGSIENPFNNMVMAIDSSARSGGGNLYIRGGEYEITKVIGVSSAAPFGSPVIIQPLPDEHVKFNYGIRAAFEFEDAAKNIEVRGIEIDGGTDELDFWCIVGQAIWGDETIPRGGGICIAVDGDSITIRDNYLHDSYQKAVEIRNGRYTDVYGNIIHSIATTSLSGGHGIMRQQKGDEFFDDDNLADYRWDIYGNMIYNVEQRIYSWVPSKGFIEMTLDEGKPILIDDPKDTNGIQEAMSGRIKNNVLAYSSIDHIRLKSTPNLEVSNNSIYADGPHADGITDRGGDTNTPKFTNFICTNNAAQTAIGRTGIEVDNAINEALASSTTPIVSGNVSAGGGIKPNPFMGLTELGDVQLFIDPSGGNFRLNPALSLPASTGVDPTILDQIDARADQFGIIVKWDGWTNDDIILSQTIIDNIPNVYDNTPGNETVFTDYGTFSTDTADIHFDVIPSWQSSSGSTATQEFRLNEDYLHWYKEIIKNYQNQNAQSYPRVRYGASVLKQDFMFPNDWLHVSEISADTNTIMYGIGYKFTLDGDLLIKFDGVIPTDGDYFDLIVADTIVSANAGDLFDYVQFDGYTPMDYSISIIQTTQGQAVRLMIGATVSCQTTVTNTDDTGVGSFRDALGCVADGGTITLSATITGDTIKLTSAPIIIDKSVSIISENQMIYLQNCTSGDIQVATAKTVMLNNFQILSDSFVNKGDLNCTDMVFRAKASTDKPMFINEVGATLIMDNEVKVE